MVLLFFYISDYVCLECFGRIRRDDIVGFSDNKYVIGRPPVSYNLYKKDSGETILDNVIGYKREKIKAMFGMKLNLQ